MPVTQASGKCIYRTSLPPTPENDCWCGVFKDQTGLPSFMCQGEENCRAKHVPTEEYRVPHIPYPNAKDWDALIPVPYHCLIRLLNATSASGLVGEGSALERDILMTEQAIKDECDRTNNKQ